MNILQFLRIFWARRGVVLTALIASFIGAYIVLLIVQPRYEATSRVQVNMTRPDLVTGEFMSAKGAGAYFDAQIELIRDYRVTGRLVDVSGWLSDPGKIEQYARRSPADTRDFRRWLAESVNDSVKTSVAGSVVEITYRAPTAAMARLGAETMRSAYLDASLALRRDEAGSGAVWYNEQAEAARKLANTAEITKAAYEKESGIIMQGRESDLDSERLAALAGQSSITPMMSAPVAAAGSASLQLATIDAQLAEATKRLGPNHPEMLELKARRGLVAQVAAQEQSAARAAASGETGAAVIARALQQQKARVIGQRDKVERLRQLQAEVDLRRDQYRSTAAKAAQFSLEAGVIDIGLKPLGLVVTPAKPAFPNKPLILAGAIGLGSAIGLALALLLELLNRRVRGVEDLHLSSEIHCVGVVEQPMHKRRWAFLRRLVGGEWRQRTGAAA